MVSNAVRNDELFSLKQFWISYYFFPLAEDDFLDTTIWYKMWYLMMATTTVRFKYYHAWLLADAICNNSGLGFNGYEKDGNPKWDLISNINVISFEVSALTLFSTISITIDALIFLFLFCL